MTNAERSDRRVRVITWTIVVALIVAAGVAIAALPLMTASFDRFARRDVELRARLVNASILVSAAVNLVYLVTDPRWLRALGDVVTTGVGIAALVRIRAVFPFTFTDTTLDWTLVANVLLVVGIVGSAIGIVAALVAFVRSVAAPSD